MDQMAKGLLFGAAVLSQAAAGCFPAAAASIDRVRIRLAAEELDEMGMPVLEAESRDRAYSVTGVERISGDPASGPAMDRAEVGKKENEQYKGSIQADSENIGTKEVSLEERKIEEIRAEEPIRNRAGIRRRRFFFRPSPGGHPVFRAWRGMQQGSSER